MYILIPVCLIILYPFIKFFIKRIILRNNIKRICRLKKFNYKANRSGDVFGNFKGENCDFYIETPDKVYSVKLCGTYFKKNLCDFMDKTHYAIRALSFQLPHTRNSVKYKVKTKPEYNFKYKFSETYHDKELIPIILMNPTSVNVTYNKSEIGNSDSVGEGFFYTRNGFCEKLISDS